jgi:hypothetical protein
VFDGVDFDDGLVHQDARRAETNRFYLQVHNRGYKPTSNVTVRAFTANASGGLPPLPSPLVPPAFNLSSAAVWTPVGPARTIATLLPNRPAVVSWDVPFPSNTATHTCCLAVVSSPDDPITSSETDLNVLVPREKRVCLKNLHVVDPGSAAAPATIVGIDFFNPEPEPLGTEVLVQPTGFGRGTVGIVFPKTVKVQPKSPGRLGVTLVEIGTDDTIGSWYNAGRGGEDKGLAKRWRGLDRSRIWMFDSNRESRLTGIELPPRRAAEAVVVVSHKRDLPMSLAPRVSLLQMARGRIVGGSTFQIGYDGSSSPAQVRTQRIRILASRLERAKPGRSVLWVRATVAGDPGRSTLAPVDGGRLFDGWIADGEPLLLELLETSPRGRPDAGEVVFSRRFEGHANSWLGEHQTTRRRAGLKLAYRVEEVSLRELTGAD